MQSANNTRLVLGGYFGCGNLGDEAVLSGLLTGLKDLNVEPIILSGDPQATTKRYGVKAVSRMKLSEVKAVLRNADALVMGGGSLLQDVTSRRSLFYYLYLIRLAKKLTGRVVMVGQGIGPLQRSSSRLFTKLVLNKTDVIAVRDADSFHFLKSLKIKTPIELTADTAWLLEPDFEGARRLLKEVGVNPKGALVGLAPRPWHTHPNDELAKAFADLAFSLHKEGFQPIGIAMDREVDIPFWKLIHTYCPNVPIVENIQTPEEAAGLISLMDSLVAMRLHALLFAAKACVPSLAVIYDPKVHALASLLDLPTPLTMRELTSEQLLSRWLAINSGASTLKNQLATKRDTQISLATRNIALIRQALPSL